MALTDQLTGLQTALHDAPSGCAAGKRRRFGQTSGIPDHRLDHFKSVTILSGTTSR